MTTKAKRQEIYRFIEEHIAVIDKSVLSYLSQHLKELCKIHNENLLAINNKLQIKCEENKAIRIKSERVKNKPEKPKTDEPFFNQDFIR